QVVVALIPGEPVEILAGYLCGTLGGLVVCLLGIAIGTAIIYGLVMRLGKGLVLRVGSSKAYERLGFLHKSTARDSLLFLLFFIPGTPKDFLTYFAPLLQIGRCRLLLIVTVARIPSVVSSTYLGATLSSGDLKFSVLLFVLIGAVGLLGIALHDLVVEKMDKKKTKYKK
ncbi:MAG: VTT domain-containing protein, partial [Clostridia bacterium]|nr:VTT domain-containing protein [Clostridia bacterium]